MTVRKRRSVSDWLAALFEGVIRTMVGCFVLGIVFILAVVFVSDYHYNPFLGRLPSVGPRVPIPNVAAATLLVGRNVYQREGCHGCHTLLTGAASKVDRYGKQKDDSIPDLTHEGERNASIDWQIDNLRDHHRLFPNSIMPDCDDLPTDEIRALASFMATRK